MARKGLGSLADEVYKENKPQKDDVVVVANPVTPDNVVVREIVDIKGTDEYNKVMHDITNVVGVLEVNRVLLEVTTNEAKKYHLDLTSAQSVLKSYKDTIDVLAKKISDTTEQAGKFVCHAKLDDESVNSLKNYQSGLLTSVKKEWSAFGSAQKKLMEENKTEMRKLFADNSGVWFSSAIFWMCFTIFSLLFLFYGLMVYINIAELQSGVVTVLLWLFGIGIAIAVALTVWLGKK
jgi:hypothetical protein